MSSDNKSTLTGSFCRCQKMTKAESNLDISPFPDSFIYVLSPFISDRLTLACSSTAVAACSQPPNLRWNLPDDTGLTRARERSRLTFFSLLFFLRDNIFSLNPEEQRNLFLVHVNTRAGERVMLPISGADVDGEAAAAAAAGFSPAAQRRLLIPLETRLEETKVRYTPEIRLMQLRLRRRRSRVQISASY